MANGPLPLPAGQRGWGRLLLGWLLAVFLVSATAQALLPVPPLKERVTDQTGTLPPEARAALEARLRAFEERKGVQIAVLMVRSTAPEPIEQYALRVVEQWKFGRQRVDDGALLLVAKDDRAVRIEVGYGIEGVLSDILSRRIIDEQITPRFRDGDFQGGITAGVDQMMRLIDGEALPAPSSRSRPASADPGQFWPFVVVVVAVALGGVLRRLLGRFGGAMVVGGVLGGLAWFAVGTLVTAAMAGLAGFFLTLLGVGMGGFVGGLPGRRDGSGWSGGGGFHGGGGGFGGGGASGRW